jgi:BASS family bile acid:Na+ symporter
LTTRLPGLASDLRLGVIVAACVPDAMASGAITLMAHGNVSYSVSMTICSTLLSPLVAPWAMQAAVGRDVPIDVVDIGRTLVLQVVGPVLLGHFACRRWGASARLERISATLAHLSILWIVAVVVGLNRERIAELFGGARSPEAGLLLAALLGLNLGGYLVGYGAGSAVRLDEARRRALSLTVGLQNAGLGTSLILTVFPEHPGAAIPTALYTFGSMWTGAAVAEYWRRREVRPTLAAEQQPPEGVAERPSSDEGLT